MGYPNKIVTCCYCGSRAALVLRGKDRHELACANCGAPLHDLKMLPSDRRGDRETVQRRRVGPAPADVVRPVSHLKPPKTTKPRKRRKGMFRYVLEEAFDLIEDVFD